MAKTTTVKSIVLGTLSGLVLLPILAVLCTFFTLKNGSVNSTADVCAIICSLLAGIVSSVITVKLSKNSSYGLVSSLIIGAVLLLSSTVFSKNSITFSNAIAVIAGGVLVYLYFRLKKKKPRKSKRPSVKKRKR